MGEWEENLEIKKLINAYYEKWFMLILSGILIIFPLRFLSFFWNRSFACLLEQQVLVVLSRSKKNNNKKSENNENIFWLTLVGKCSHGMLLNIESSYHDVFFRPDFKSFLLLLLLLFSFTLSMCSWRLNSLNNSNKFIIIWIGFA
jgi:hypothetical protein